ncbi:MAG: prenyltransferase/squalene oxidase repeat-containing protein [Planctomycetota bacterium]
MRRGRLLPLLLLAALLGVGVSAGSRDAAADFGKDEQKFDNQAYPAEFRGRVLEAIVRGANWLLTHQREDGSWTSVQAQGYPMGPTALATLALLKCGIPPGHPKITRAFAYLKQQKMLKVYEVAVLMMALDAKYDPAPDPFAKEEVDRYGNRVVPEPCAENMTKEDLAWMKQGVDFLVGHQTGGYWRYPEGGFDLSNTQYALLGLKAADRCGLKVPLEVWRASLAFLLDHQDADGAEVELRGNEVRGDYRVEWKEKAKARGFKYVAKGMRTTGAMTTAGAAGLMICQSMLWKSRKFTGEDRQRTREAIRDALAWMQTNFSVVDNPGAGPTWHYYYLYGLERMGVVAHLRFLGRTDWYLDGAELLLMEQDDRGSWQAGDVVDTCFALLFLKRSSFRITNATVTPSEPNISSAPGETAPPKEPAPKAKEPVAPR